MRVRLFLFLLLLSSSFLGAQTVAGFPIDEMPIWNAFPGRSCQCSQNMAPAISTEDLEYTERLLEGRIESGLFHNNDDRDWQIAEQWVLVHELNRRAQQRVNEVSNALLARSGTEDAAQRMQLGFCLARRRREHWWKRERCQ